MKNKIISWLLLASTCMTLFLTSCSDLDAGYEEETSSIPDITLTLYGIKGEGTTDEAIDLVEAQINRYTQDKYKTTVELHLFTDEEYDQTIEDAFLKIEEQTERNELAEKAATAAAKAAREAAKSLSIEEQKEKKRAQREYEKWAELRGETSEEIDIEMSDDIQLDLFMVDDYVYYSDLAERELIADISSSVTGTQSLITKYVNPIILSVAKLNGTYYGVPANRLMAAENNKGYLYAFRTDLLEKYPLELSEIPAINSLDPWLEQIQLNEKGVVPFFAPPEAIQNFDYYNDDMENFPAYGTKNNEAMGTTSYELQFVLEAGSGMTTGTAYFHYRKMAKYRSLNYFAPEGSDPATTDFAVGIFKGSLEQVKAQLGDKAEDFTYATYMFPRVTTKDAFGSTFVVSSSCKYPDRAVQLIRGFCTDETLRNLITFGVQDVHYELNDDGETVTKLTNDYNIDFQMYGNSLIGYVPEELGATYQADAINANKNMKVSAFVGYTLEPEEADLKAYEAINDIAKEYVNSLMNGVEDIDATVEEILVKMGKEEDHLALYPDSNDEDGYIAPYHNLLAGLDSGFATFSGSRPGGVTEIDNNIITKEEQARRDAEEALLNPEITDPALEGEEVVEGEETVEGEIVDEPTAEGEATTEDEIPVVTE